MNFKQRRVNRENFYFSNQSWWPISSMKKCKFQLNFSKITYGRNELHMTWGINTTIV